MLIFKPIVFFDLETTGVDVSKDRIVEIAVTKMDNNGIIESKTMKLNPTIPIPNASSEIHRIFDKDVVGCPTFKQISKSLLEFFEGCDIGGYNIKDYDVPLLANEFARCGLLFEIKTRQVLDVYRIVKKINSSSLSKMYEKYTGKILENAHSAEADNFATFEVMKAMIEQHPELPNNVDSLTNYIGYDASEFDPGRKFRWDVEGNLTWNFTKSKGNRVTSDKGLINWFFAQDFVGENSKMMLREYLKRIDFKY